MTSTPHPAALGLLLFASTFGLMASATIVPNLEAIRTDFGLGGTAAGLIITAHGLAIAILSPLVGWIIDRWGVRLLLAAGLILYGVAGGTGMVISSYPLLIASRFLFGVGVAVVYTGARVAMLGLYRGSARNRIMGWSTTASGLGGIFYPIIGGALGTMLTWRSAFAVYLIAIPIGLAVLMMVPDTHSPQKRSESDRDTADAMHFGPALIGVYILLFMVSIMVYSIAVFLSQRLAQLGVEKPIFVSTYIAAMAGTASLVGLSYAWIRTRASYLALLRFSALTWVAAFLILGLVAEPLVLPLATILIGLGNGVVVPLTAVLIAELVPESSLGRATAIASTLVFLGQFASPLIVGPVMAVTSITTGYLFISGLAAAILLVLLLIRAHGDLGSATVANLSVSTGETSSR